jgi:hypothetical protein
MSTRLTALAQRTSRLVDPAVLSDHPAGARGLEPEKAYLVGKGVAGVLVLLAGAYMNRCEWCRKSVLIADDKLLLCLVNSDFLGSWGGGSLG